jgi:hypothetical protein
VTALIPTSHLDLVDCPPVAALATVMPNGDPQRRIHARRITLDAIHA